MLARVLGIFLLFFLPALVQCEASRIEISPLPINPNLLPNPSFEEWEDGHPVGWIFDKRNTDATLERAEDAHSGKYCVKITNNTPFGPHVYGSLYVPQGIPVEPNTTYTLSCYIKSEDPGVAWIGGGRGWMVRCHLPPTGGKWRRVSLTFTTSADETVIPFLINTDSPTKGFWVDDVKLEKGDKATPFQVPSSLDLEITPFYQDKPGWMNETYRGCLFVKDKVALFATLSLPQPLAGELRFLLKDREGNVLSEVSKGGNFQQGVFEAKVELQLDKPVGGECKVEGVVVSEGRELLRKEERFKMITGGDVEEQMGKVKGTLNSLRQRMKEVKGDPSLQGVTATVLENFLNYAREDLEKGEIARAWYAVNEMQEIGERSLSSLNKPLSGSFLQIDGGNAPWSEEDWRKELSYMKALGMDTLIIGAVAWDSYAFYPSRLLSYYREAGTKDVVGTLLKLADELKMKVFLGLYAWNWEGKGSEGDFEEFTQRNINVAKELQNLYGREPSFEGWYLLTWEIGNAPPPDNVGVKAYIKVINALRRLTPKKKLLIAPYFTLDISPQDFKKGWSTLLSHLKVDIIALQDGVGCERGITPEKAEPYFQALREVCGQKGVSLWADLEIFDIPAGWKPAPLPRIFSQINALSPYVDKIVVFEFNHYMSPLRSDEAKRLFEGYRQSRLPLLPIPRYVTSPIKIKGTSFLAKARYPTGREEERPVFFVGYGAFGQVRADIEKFPSYGTNIIQIEFGPSSVFPKENEVSDAPIREFLSVLDRAKANNVAVNLLISPHYFPAWAYEKYPHLRNFKGGFLQFDINAPESRDILESYLRFVIPKIKDHPALHSICLTNEPISVDLRGSLYAKRMWQDWLKKRHQTIEKLNDIWGTNYPSFEEIDLPPPQLEPTPRCYDYALFNQEEFAGWHRWMADIIHEMAPNLPVHAKIMTTFFFDGGGEPLFGIDPELFGEFSQINGNDCWKWYNHRGESGWANSWQIENMGYDLQRSVADKPIFNSENHLIVDRDLEYIPPEHIYNVLWQGAVHGQSATTIWVWERTYDPKSDFAGSIMHRPACAEAVGLVCLNLNRLSKEMKALQEAKPSLYILYSFPSIIYNRGYLSTLQKVYEALNFLGLKIGFVTERQLAREMLPQGPIIVPFATHISNEAFHSLKRFVEKGGKVVLIGENCLERDEYDKVREDRIQGIVLPRESSSQELWRAFEKMLGALGIKREITLEGRNGEPNWGVECISVKDGKGYLVNLVNYTTDPKEIRLRGSFKNIRDLTTGQMLSQPLILLPLQPLLLRLE